MSAVSGLDDDGWMMTVGRVVATAIVINQQTSNAWVVRKTMIVDCTAMNDDRTTIAGSVDICEGRYSTCRKTTLARQR